ncbi:MAG: hypothetical protein WAW33_00185 [Minisyncoccia bacterium]
MELQNQTIENSYQSPANTSGQGKNSVVPDEIQDLNWGAFFLNVIWGLFHHVWWSLLVLVPYLGIIMIILLGIKGNEWAWRAQHYDSIKSFKRIEERWAIGGIILASILVLTWIWIFWIVMHIQA